VESGFGVVGV